MPTFTVFGKPDSRPAQRGRARCSVVAAALTPMLNSSLTEAVPSLAVTFTASVSNVRGLRGAREGARGAGEAQPRGQVVAVGFRCRVGQCVALRVGEGVRAEIV